MVIFSEDRDIYERTLIATMGWFDCFKSLPGPGSSAEAAATAGWARRGLSSGCKIWDRLSELVERMGDEMITI